VATNRSPVDAGINFFDTADVYSRGESERITGKLLKDFGVRRENVIVATKVNGQRKTLLLRNLWRTSRKNVMSPGHRLPWHGS
jgi:aryl-alcohol dehydrogenase-like predicted oxidoreductase